jgi:hypothetical protein
MLASTGVRRLGAGVQGTLMDLARNRYWKRVPNFCIALLPIIPVRALSRGWVGYRCVIIA